MNKRFSMLTFALSSLFFTAFVQADEVSNTELLQQLDALSKRVEALEQKLGQVEATQETFVSETSQAAAPWSQLTIGMKFSEVEELLGKPTSKQKGGVELWFYSKTRKEGPFVKFIFKQVHSWRAPEQNR